ncbi:hypothetical protein BCR33DRAFT_780625 [Rhizoclosmatium globosum]|uniref:Nephrocystin 3-like N-terminal domain-containing protein n=1 Tax=Rhizoclosmatium globosum TaxID=329046 RepID=A0A1Y2CXD7_9FUNG|nr:hypothetical protein BCR33DRAFT_780625 [Rhizoclosmatium globosum]|eukprot:ORY51691.1 hypothetical protein BCR33DRAFT_780625 [Rhizoclosmatium globosum]
MGSCHSKPQATSTVHANVPVLKVDIPVPESLLKPMSVSAKPASVGSIFENREALPAAGIGLVGTTGHSGLGQTLRDLLGPTQLKELKEASRTLFDSIARRHPGLEEVSSLLEQWNNAETKYNTMKPKLDELWTKLKQPDPASGNWETIATAVTGIMDTIDQVANSSLVLKLVWLAVTTVYKADSEAAFKDLVDEFQSGMNHIQSLVTTSTSGLTDEAVYSVKIASERYVSSLIELVNTCSEYDNSGSGFEAFGGWKTRFESILADLKVKEYQLSKTEGTATFVVSTATHGLAVETHEELSTRAEDKTNEKMETLREYLAPVSQRIKSDIIYGRDWFVSDVKVWWEEKTNDNCRKYWLCVEAGFGKSKMACKVFQDFKGNPEYRKKGQSFFFFAFDHNDASYRDPATCVKTLAYDVAEYYKESVPEITNVIVEESKNWFSKRDNTSQPSVEDLFRDLIAKPLRWRENVEVLLIIDALDEASGDALVSILKEDPVHPTFVSLYQADLRPS